MRFALFGKSYSSGIHRMELVGFMGSPVDEIDRLKGKLTILPVKRSVVSDVEHPLVPPGAGLLGAFSSGC